MKWKIKQILLKVALGIIAIYAATMIIGKLTQPKIDTYKVITLEEQVSSSEYIISKELILGKLTSKSQIVSLEQSFEDTSTHVDDGWTGERITEMTVKGSFLMGLETKDIQVSRIENATGLVYIKLGEPKLISLDIPFDKVNIDKTKGWLRLSLNDAEEKKFFKSVKKNVEQEIISDEEILRQTELFNQEAVREIVKLIPTVKEVVFE